MDRSSIDPIRKVHALAETISPAKPVPAATDLAATRRGASAAGSEEIAKHVESVSRQLKGQTSISLHFRVDDKTNELTVFVIDRKSKRVLRSIPASELHKLQVGELLKLAA